MQGWEEKHKRIFILVHSSRAMSSSPYSKVESTKTDTIIYSTQQFLNPSRTPTTKAEKTLFQHTLHSKKPYLEWLTLIPITRMNKGKTTPEIVLQEHKPIVLFAPRQYQHLQPAQGSSRTNSHVFFLLKNLCKTYLILFFTPEMLYLCWNYDCSAFLYVRKAFYFIENSF